MDIQNGPVLDVLSAQFWAKISDTWTSTAENGFIIVSLGDAHLLITIEIIVQSMFQKLVAHVIHEHFSTSKV